MDFPTGPIVGQQHPFTPVPGQPVFIWDGEKWVAAPLTGAVRYDAAQSLTAPQQTQARDNIGVSSGGGGSSVLVSDTPPVGAPDNTLWWEFDSGLLFLRFNDGTSTQWTLVSNPLSTNTVVVSGSNVVINGDFRINQTGYVSAAVLAVGAYGHDQWKAGASGGNYSFTQLKSSTQITIASGKSLIQPIEDVNVVGGSYVLTWTGTAQARAGVNTLTPSGAYAASPLLIAGQTAGTAMSIEFNNGTFGTVKLESGAIATPFIMRPYDQELVTCQRYFQVIDTVQLGVADANNAQMLCLPATMRAQPTVTNNGPAGFAALGTSVIKQTNATGGYMAVTLKIDARL